MSGLLRRLERQSGRPSGESPLSPRQQASVAEIVRNMQEKVLREHISLLAPARVDPCARKQLKDLIAGRLLAENIVVQKLTRESLAESITSEIVGYGPIEPYLNDPAVTEIMVNRWDQVYVEREGRLEATETRFRDDEHVQDVIDRIVAPVGRRIDQTVPFVDARLPDGSRVNAIIPPLSLRGPTLTIRRFSRQILSPEDLVHKGSLNREMLEFLAMCVRARLNILISGGSGTGKTSTLNALSSFIPNGSERIITLEDSAELNLRQEHVVALESRPANLEGRGEVTIRQLLRNALRMRPDRIIIGECRGPEAFDLLSALNTGHDGSLTTVHANSPRDALRRLENMVLMAGEDLPHAAVREQVRAAIDVIVHLARLADGRRLVTEIAMATRLVDWPQAAEDGELARLFWWNIGVPGGEGSGPTAFRQPDQVTFSPALTFRAMANDCSLPTWVSRGRH